MEAISDPKRLIRLAVQTCVTFFVGHSTESLSLEAIQTFLGHQLLEKLGEDKIISPEVLTQLANNAFHKITKEKERRKATRPAPDEDIQMLGRIFGDGTPQQSTAGEAEDFAGEDTVFDRPFYGPMILLSLDMAGDDSTEVDDNERVFGRLTSQLPPLSADIGEAEEVTALPPPMPGMCTEADIAEEDRLNDSETPPEELQAVARKPRQGQSRVVMVVLAVCAVIAVAFCAIRMYGARPASEAAASMLPREPATQPAPVPSIVSPSSTPTITITTAASVEPPKPKKKIRHFRRPRRQPEHCQEVVREPPPAPLILGEDSTVGGS